MYYQIKGVDVDKCNGCEKCVQICHHNCFEMVESNNKVVADFIKPEKCDACGDCIVICPVDHSAIMLKPLNKNKKGYVVKIEGEKCEACEKCISVCPEKNIEIVEKNGEIFAKIKDPKKCVADGDCTFCCEVDNKVYSEAKP